LYKSRSSNQEASWKPPSVYQSAKSSKERWRWALVSAKTRAARVTAAASASSTRLATASSESSAEEAGVFFKAGGVVCSGERASLLV